MGMTGFEKIVARASGVSHVQPGDVVYPVADLAFLHDGQVEASRRDLDDIGIDRLWDPSRVVFVTDHEVVYGTPRAALRGQRIRETARAWKIDHFYDVGQGGHGHIFPLERGMVGPGMFIFANDMHCTNFGAVGAVGLRAGGEIISVLVKGSLWVKVPATIKVMLRGKLQQGVLGRDLGARLARDLATRRFGVDATYRVVELDGDLDQFDRAARVALCNAPTEVGAASVFIAPSKAILAQANQAGNRTFEPMYSDPDAVYEAHGEIDLSALEPQVALPGGPEKAVDISDVVGVPIQHAFIGACGSGMYEDLELAADVLRGRKVAQGTRLFIVPGSVDSARRMGVEGLLAVFQNAGAIVLPSGCGPCAGGSMAPLTSGETSISTAATNGAGRMGAKDASIYLGSPATVAASAVAGYIADARQFDQTR